MKKKKEKWKKPKKIPNGKSQKLKNIEFLKYIRYGTRHILTEYITYPYRPITGSIESQKIQRLKGELLFHLFPFTFSPDTKASLSTFYSVPWVVLLPVAITYT